MLPVITVLGPIPPPFGGVSVHIVRFLDLVRQEGFEGHGIPYTGTTAMGKFGKMRQALAMVLHLLLKVRVGKNDTLHLHYGGLGYFLAILPLLATTQARKVVTFHSVRVIQDLQGKPKFLQKIVLKQLNAFDLFVPVREGIGEELLKYGLDKPAIVVMPAFLPPSDAERDIERLPEDLQTTLLANQASGKVQLCCAAYYLGPGYGKNDLYGVEELAQTMALLGTELRHPIDLWVLVSNHPETNAQKLAEKNVHDAFQNCKNVELHICYGVPLIPVLARCAGFLRPSREDGDSVAIREAMSLDVPVLASDVVNRPNGVKTFGLQGPEEFVPVLSTWLEDLEPVTGDQARDILPGERQKFGDFVRQVAGTGV